MNPVPPKPSLRRALPLLAAFALLAAAASAADRIPTQQARDAASLTEATRQLEAVKSAAKTGSAAEQGGAPAINLPAAPQFQPESTPSPRPADAAPAPKSANWLVDAMMTPERDRRDGRPAGERRAPRRSGSDDPEAKADGKEALASEAQRAGPEASPAKPAPNPFSRYLADWMRPQDYALLQHTMERRDEIGAGPVGAPGQEAAFAGDAGLEQAFAAVAAERANRNQAALTRPPMENPFLQALAPPETVPPATLAPPPPAASHLVPSPPLPEPPKPVVPDFAKRPEEEKYLKRLKRF